METSLRVDEVLDGLLHLLRMAAGGLHPTVEDIDAARQGSASTS
ncbi:hypothetical protein [Xanthomonas oryzae]|nr:hypothetical protein [Xanthomonas oryzae]